MVCCVFFERKTAYEVRISDWSSDVGSSDLAGRAGAHAGGAAGDPLAHVAFDRDLLGLFLAQLLLGPFGRRLARSRPPAEQQPAEQARLGRRRRFHADHALGAVAHAIAAAAAAGFHEDWESAVLGTSVSGRVSV